MPWNDKGSPGPWNAPSSEGQSPPDADKAAGGRSDSGRPATGGRNDDTPWGGAPRLRDRPTAEPSRPKTPKSETPPPRGPDMDELSRAVRARLTQAFGQGSARRFTPKMAGAALVALVAAWSLTGVYGLQPGQQGIVTRFGAYVRRVGPGLSYHLPFPIEAVRKVSLSTVERLDIGGSGGEETPGENQMLTRDGSLVDLDYTAQWRVSDAARYVFRLADPDGAVKTAAESAMRQAVGQTALQDVLSNPAGLQGRATALMQAALDRDGAGVAVVGVQVRAAEPPQDAAAALHGVAAARQDADTAAADANVYRDRVVGEAKAAAARTLLAAQGYRDQVEAEAKGEADRFSLIDAQYRRAPEVTRQRIYIETMEHVLRASNKVVIGGSKGPDSVVLPPELFKTHPTPDAAPAARAPATPKPPEAPAPAPAQTQGQPAARTDPNGVAP